MDHDVRIWLLNTFAVNNLIHESHALNERILFEKIPSGQRFLTAIIESMRDEFCIEINYCAFWMDKPILMEIEPFCVKIFKRRWYLIGKNRATDELRHYALDRMSEVRLTGEKFKLPKNFNSAAHFTYSFGIVVDPDIKPCIIKIKVFGEKRKYLNTLPLHTSQEETETNDKYSVFQYHIAPTYDFVLEVLSQGEEIEVIYPESLRNEIAQRIEKMNNRYKKVK
jgi:predicted DNA-binding transcriptional regulator YafY